LEFLRGAVRLNSDHTFTDSTELKVTPLFHGATLQGGEVQQRFDVQYGLYRLAGDTVYFDSLTDEHYFMVLQAAGPLVQDLKGVATLVYRR
jgi:hypothetical protein